MTREEAKKIIWDTLAKSAAECRASGVGTPSRFLDACHYIDELLAAVAAERAARDAKWRAWWLRISPRIHPSDPELLEEYDSPPDREP